MSIHGDPQPNSLTVVLEIVVCDSDIHILERTLTWSRTCRMELVFQVAAATLDAHFRLQQLIWGDDGHSATDAFQMIAPRNFVELSDRTHIDRLVVHDQRSYDALCEEWGLRRLSIFISTVADAVEKRSLRRRVCFPNLSIRMTLSWFSIDDGLIWRRFPCRTA